MNKEQLIFPHFTMILSKENLSKIKKEINSNYLILAEKPCLYTNEEYMVIEFAVLSYNKEDTNLQELLKDTGGLIIHKSKTAAFCIEENDIDELSDIYCWSGSGGLLMGDLLSSEDKEILLKDKQKDLNEQGDISIDIGLRNKEEYVNIVGHFQELFEFEGNVSFNGKKTIENIWWPDILEENGNFYVAILQTKNYDIMDEDEYYYPYYDYYY